MKILIAGYFAVFWHEEAWARALRELGHEVVEFRMAPYIQSDLVNRVQDRFMFGPLISRLNKEFITQVAKHQADIVLCYRALPIDAKFVRLAKTDCKSLFVSYQHDNVFGVLRKKAYWKNFKRAIPCYDLHLVTGQRGFQGIDDLADYKAHGAKEIYLLYHSYIPWLHRRLPRDSLNGWESDICFLGHCEPDRRITELNSLMGKVSCTYRLHGSNWDKHGKNKQWEGIDTYEIQGEEYVKGINGAKIALAFFSAWNIDMYTNRVFEIPACGTFMLSQRTETMQMLYEEDQEAVYFDNADELVDKARFYLQNNTVRQRIAQAGYQRCLRSGYDIYSRMREWTALAQQLLATKASL